MPALFRRNTTILCFFCQTLVSSPTNPRNFKCSTCGCWNRFDKNGEIISDEPAMHDESLNARSFARRASPSKDRLPTMYGKGPFCHTCQTNQMLLVNLLSNYLPLPTSPEYEHRLEQLPEYRESLHLRYPPVCTSCLPAVEDEIRKKDTMARTQALGGWLKQTKGKERIRRVSSTTQGKEKVGIKMIMWRVRGFLWLTTLAVAVGGNSTAALGYHPLSRFTFLQPALPIIAIFSLLWTVWDPTYSSFRSAQLQGRDVRVRGKTQYATLQIAAWASRMITSAFLAFAWFRPKSDHLHLHNPASSRNRVYFTATLALELFALVSSCMVLRLQQPPAIRLIDTNTHKHPSRSTTPYSLTRASTPALGSTLTAAEPDLLASLTLSSKPVITPTNPVFGLPSLVSSVPQPSVEGEDNDEMDWTPTDPLSASASSGSRDKFTQQEDDGSWLRPQRFFAPEHPTGLEGLFERTKLVDDPSGDRFTLSVTSRASAHIWNWWWVYTSSFVFLAMAYKAWGSMKIGKVITDATPSL